MKRPSSSSSANVLNNSPPKKQKRSPSISESETSSAEEDQNDQVVVEKWVKVEKPKSKKAKKLEAKFDVCVSLLSSSRIYRAELRRLLPRDFDTPIRRFSSARIPLASTYDAFHLFSYMRDNTAIRMLATLSST
jgi:hypothetical protein